MHPFLRLTSSSTSPTRLHGRAHRWVAAGSLAVSLTLLQALNADDGMSSNSGTMEIMPASLSTSRDRRPLLPAPPRETLNRLLQLHNDVRARRGLPVLKLSTRLTAAAQRYADYSHRTGQFGHYADGRTPSDRIAAEGLRHGSCAENMAWGMESPQDAMNIWLGSSAHHGNILSGHTHVGFGQVGSIWVTVFANPDEAAE
jgi:uncharacterized protein YkwD